MTTHIACRAAGADDLSAVLALYRALIPNDPDLPQQKAEATFQAMLGHPGLTICLALEGTRPVATATLIIVPNLTRNARPYALVENVATLESHRGRGFGKAVMGYAAETAFSEGCYKVMLMTGSLRPAVHAFYRRCGFVQNKTGFQIRAAD